MDKAKVIINGHEYLVDLSDQIYRWIQEETEDLYSYAVTISEIHIIIDAEEVTEE